MRKNGGNRNSLTVFMTMLIVSIAILTSAFKGCDWPWSNKKTLGIIPIYTDSNNTEFSKSDLIAKSFYKVIRELRSNEIKLKDPIIFEDVALYPGDVFAPCLEKFYRNVHSGAAYEKEILLNRLMKENKCDVLFWGTYIIDLNEKVYRVNLYGYRKDNKMFLSRPFPISFSLDDDEIEDISGENFRLLAKEILKG